MKPKRLKIIKAVKANKQVFPIELMLSIVHSESGVAFNCMLDLLLQGDISWDTIFIGSSTIVGLQFVFWNHKWVLPLKKAEESIDRCITSAANKQSIATVGK